MAQPLNLRTRAFIWTVTVGGIVVGLGLALRSSITADDWPPILAFGSMAALATVASISYRSPQPSSITYQIMTAFAYSAFLLVNPAAVSGVLWLTTLADKFLNRRDWLKTAFNIGQLTLAVAIAHGVRSLIEPQFAMARLDASTILAAAVSIVVFALVNHGLTQTVIAMANRRPLFASSFALRTGVLLEFLCVLSGLGMAVLWCIKPWMAALGAIPTWTMFFLVQMLSRRDNELQAREVELHSLQDLGLELGSELDVERLRETVLRITCDAFKADRALLAIRDDDGKPRIEAHRNFDPAPPATLALPELDDGFFSAGKVRHIESPRGLSKHADFLTADCDGALLAPVEIRGRCTGVLMLMHGAERRAFDADDVRRLESLIRFVNVALSNAELVVELKEVQSQLAHSEKMSALGMLVAGVAHELNNPLTSVLGYAELLQNGEMTPRQQRMLETVGREARRAGKIVNNLLMFSRKRKPSKRLVQVNHILGEVLEFRAYEQAVHNVGIVPELTDDLPSVFADPHQLHQVFLNLLTNAEQAIGGTGKPGCITARTEKRDGKIRIVISDNGPGIHPDHLKQVFVPFFTTKEVGRGTGLGLSICYGIIEEHGGTIDVESGDNRGAAFAIEIPIAAVAAESGAANAEVLTTHEEAGGGRMLIVDDEPDITEVVTLYFEGRGWTVNSAMDGRQALDLLTDRTFDVLVVDLRMPGMDGAEFYRSLKSSRPDVAQRVIFATGDAGDAASARFLEKTGAPVVSKPFDLVTLERAVSRLSRPADSPRDSNSVLKPQFRESGV